MATNSGYQIIAFDVGQKRVGVARAHSVARLPEALAIIELRHNDGWSDIQTIIDEYHPGLIVIGLPTSLRASNQQTEFNRRWAEEFRAKIRFDAKIIYQDETLTTQQARSQSAARRVDDLAAKLILEDFLASQTKDEKN